MTVTNSLERAIALAEAAKGSYLLFAAESEDQTASQVFKQMAEDMERHVMILESRLDYLNQYNPLNKQGQGQAQNQQPGGQGTAGQAQAQGGQGAQQSEGRGGGQAQAAKNGGQEGGQ